MDLIYTMLSPSVSTFETPPQDACSVSVTRSGERGKPCCLGRDCHACGDLDGYCVDSVIGIPAKVPSDGGGLGVASGVCRADHHDKMAREGRLPHELPLAPCVGVRLSSQGRLLPREAAIG